MARHNPNKPLKYPKKFRAKLEKMSAERARRKPKTPEEIDVIGRELLLKGQVHFTHGDVDEENHRLSMEHQLFPPDTLDVLDIQPPWVIPETQASS
jgi:hypothetical protein